MKILRYKHRKESQIILVTEKEVTVITEGALSQHGIG